MVSCASADRYSPMSRVNSLGASLGGPAASAKEFIAATPAPADKTNINSNVLARSSTGRLVFSRVTDRNITYRSAAIHAIVRGWGFKNSKTVLREPLARLAASQAHR